MDAARGLALIGMFVAHTLFGPGEMIVDGRSSILFATVAGVSLGLISGGPTPPPPGSRVTALLSVLVRAGFLIVLGLALTAFLNPPLAVILDYYGFAFLLMLALLFLPPAVLGGLALLVAVVAPPVAAAITGTTAVESLPDPLQLLARWLVYGEYPILTWLAFLIAGLALARAGLARRATALLALVAGVIAAVAGYGAQLLPGVTAEAHSGTTAEVFGSGGVAIAIIGALSLLDSATGAGERVANGIRFLAAPIAAAGSMPLTLYTAHAIVLAVARATTAGQGRWDPTPELLLALVAGSLLFATLWRRFIGTGPLESLLRVLTRAAVRPPTPPRVAP